MAAKRATADRRQAFFESDSVDQLLSMMLELAAELWVVRERLYVLERAAEGCGVPLRKAVEAYQLSAIEEQELQDMRRRMLRELLRNVGAPHKKTSHSASRR
jgi:hypothetical protein